MTKTKPYTFSSTDPTEPRTIVIAWLVEDFEVVRPGRADLGQRPEFRTVLVPRAVVWLREGTAQDVEKAESYAKGIKERNVRVFVYHPTREEDPLGRAKAEITLHEVR